MGSRQLSQEEIETIKKMASFETSIEQLAKAIGRESEAGCRVWVRKLDLPYYMKPLSDLEKMRIQELSDGKRSYQEIALELGRKRTMIESYVLKENLPRQKSGGAPGRPHPNRAKGMSDAQKARVLELYETGMALSQIALDVGRTHNSVEKFLHKQGLNSRKAGPPKGERNHFFLHGDYKPGDYKRVMIPKDHPLFGSLTAFGKPRITMKEHRLVMEQKLGRYLLPDEVVHHIDGNPANNAPDNLEVFSSHAEHMQHHLHEKTDHMPQSDQED